MDELPRYRENVESLRDWFEHALNNYGDTIRQAAEYSLVEHNLRGNAVGETLAVTALIKIALDREGVDFSIADLSLFLREYCDEQRVAAAAAAIEDDSDRQAFLRDAAEVRTALSA